MGQWRTGCSLNTSAAVQRTSRRSCSSHLRVPPLLALLLVASILEVAPCRGPKRAPGLLQAVQAARVTIGLTRRHTHTPTPTRELSVGVARERRDGSRQLLYGPCAPLVLLQPSTARRKAPCRRWRRVRRAPPAPRATLHCLRVGVQRWTRSSSPTWVRANARDKKYFGRLSTRRRGE